MHDKLYTQNNNLLAIDSRKNDYSILLDTYRAKYHNFLNNNIIFKLKRFVKFNSGDINFIHLNSLLKMLDIIFKVDNYNENFCINHARQIKF